MPSVYVDVGISTLEDNHSESVNSLSKCHLYCITDITIPFLDVWSEKVDVFLVLVDLCPLHHWVVVSLCFSEDAVQRMTWVGFWPVF